MFNKIILLTIMVALTGMLGSCSSTGDWLKDTFEPKSDMDEVHEYHRPLEKQRLIPRQGHKGNLTNRVCLKWYGSKCEKESIRDYSLKDKKVRKRLIGLHFACHIGGKRYRICQDKIGYCRREQHEVCKKWGRTLFRRKKVCRKMEKEVKTKFISAIDDHQFLLDARTECKKGL